jgi:hypothetical protein
LVPDYLIGAPHKEHEAIRRLPGLFIRLADMMTALGLNPWFSWYLLEVSMDNLCSSLKGDVDILGGSLSWKIPQEYDVAVTQERQRSPEAHPSWHYEFAARQLAGAGRMKWPPDTDYLVGIEAKCSYLNPEADLSSTILEEHIKSKKSSRGKVKGIHNEIKKLETMGFNRVALLDWIANPPQGGTGIDAWLAAGRIARDSEAAMSDVFGKRLPKGSISGHWVDSIGAVLGGDETMRGSGRARELRRAQENPLARNSIVRTRRGEMQGRLRTILEGLGEPAREGPAFLSMFFIHCKSCGRIHRLGGTCV